MKSYNEYAEIRVSQKAKQNLAPLPLQPPISTTKSFTNPTPKSEYPTNQTNSPKPVTLPVYPELRYNINDASSFSRVLIVDKEIDGGSVFSILEEYKKEGWRLLNRSELVFLFENHKEKMPNTECGYWIQCNEKGDLQSVSYGPQGKIDPTPNENRIIFVK